MLPDFQENQKIEAQDQYGKWYVARVVQVDHEEKEVLIHFEGWNARYDEWISCNSFRLRPLSMENKRKLQEKKLKKFQVGDPVQARWVNGKYYPATVKVIDNLCDKATVQFQDNVEHTVLLKDIRPQKKPDKQSEWAKLQQEAKEREDRHTPLARKPRAKKRTNVELDTSGESPKQPGTPSKKPKLEGDDGEAKKLSAEVSTSPQSSVTESGNVSPSSADDSKNPGVSKRKAYTPLRTQYCLRETVVPIQPLSLEQHGKNDSPSKVTRRISSTEDNEDPLQSSSTKGPVRQAGGTMKGKQEEASGKKRRAAPGKHSKKSGQEATPVSSVPAVISVTSPEPLFLTPPLDVASKVADGTSKLLSTQVVQPTPPYTPKQVAPHVSTAEDHKTQPPSSPTSPNNMSIDDLSLASDSRDTSSSFNDKSPPPSDPKSISLTCFNVDILNNEDDKSASPAVVTIDPNAITHSPINSTEPTSSVNECDQTEERLFVECTKKTASIICNKSSPSRPSLLPFRRRSLSTTTDQTSTKPPPVSSRGRRKSEGGRSNQTRRRQSGSARASRKSSGTVDGIGEKDMAPKELVIKMDHNDYKCSHPDCGKSFRKESLLQWHYKHYHPGKGQHSTVVASPKTKSPVHKSPVHKSPSNKQPPNSVPPTPPTLLAVAKQQEQAVQSATQAITTGPSKPLTEKSKTKKVLTPVITPVIPFLTSLSTATISATSQSSATKELPITAKISVPKEPVISPFLPSVSGVSSEVSNLKSVLGITTLASEPIKLPTSVAMELLKGSAVHMIAPKPSVIQTSVSTTSTLSFTPTTVTMNSPIGTVFKGFPPVTAVSTSSTHLSWTTRVPTTSTPRPSSPGRKGVVIRGHPRGETSRSRGAAISRLSDDSSIEDLDVGEEYRPSGERHTRASRPFGSSSCSYYCSGNKDDVIHCLCGSFEDEGFMIQCEQCLCWQHADCVGIDEEQPPEHYLCCICQSPHALRRNAKFKFDRSWYKDGSLPSLVGGAAFTCSDDVINTHKISGSLGSLNQCLHSLEQLLTVAGQPNHPLLKHWDSGKESAITRKLTQRLTTMLKDKESEKEEQSSDLTNSLERAARTTPIDELQLGGGAGSGNHAKRPLQLAPLPPISTTKEESHLQNFDDKQSSCASDSSINVTSLTSLQLPPLPPHRRKLFDDESNCSTPGLQNLSSISTPLADEETQMEHSGLDLLTEVAATCSRLSTPSTISQDKSPVGETPVSDGDHHAAHSNVAVMPSSSPVASFMDEFGMEEASVFALTPSTVTTPELDQSITAVDQQLSSVPPPSEPSPDDKASQTIVEETESQDQNMQSVMELIERLTSDLDTTAQLLPLVTPSQFAEAFMKVDTSCWASRMLLLDHVEAMQEKVLAQMDQLEEQFQGITEAQYSPDAGGSKKDLMKKMNNWCNLDITSAA